MYEFLISSVKKELNISEKRGSKASSQTLSGLSGTDVPDNTVEGKYLFGRDQNVVVIRGADLSLPAEDTAELLYNRKSLKRGALRQRVGHSLLSEKARRMKAFITMGERPDPGDIARFIREEETALNMASEDHSLRKSGDESALYAANLLEAFWHKKELLMADASLSTEERARQLYDFSVGFYGDIDRYMALYLEKMKDRHRKKKILVLIDRYRKLISYFEDKENGNDPDDGIFKEMGL